MAQTYAQLRLDLASALAGFLDPQEAHAEAFRWFEEGLGLGRSWLVLHGEEPVPDGTRHEVEGWLVRRRTGEPWAYILGWTEFRGRRFQVDRGTLIPRPETELVLEAALDIGRRLKVSRVCDIGTGSGILAASFALETDWAVTATDLSPEALAVARRNAGNLAAKVTFLQGDLLVPVPDPLELVVSNPPYVDPADRPGLQRELDFEPTMALFAE
ncbi:MAG TPA: HemK/PrmC family methyltransferase, partial [Holophaga sp.]|nr:HemK/PrmC family methyltransferase [Holophaga sp.]